MNLFCKLNLFIYWPSVNTYFNTSHKSPLNMNLYTRIVWL